MGTCKGVIFDLDGTLLDTLQDLRDSVNEILRNHGYPERSLEDIRNFVGNGARNLICRALPEGSSSEEMEQCFIEYRAYYAEHSQIKTCPYEGIPELLQELKNRRIVLAVVSNKSEDTVKELCKIYFPGSIAVATGDLQGYQKKPAPDNVIRAMECAGIEKEAAIYVGDSEVDIQTARNCGLKGVFVSWGFRDKTYLKECGAEDIIDNPLELLSYL